MEFPRSIVVLGAGGMAAIVYWQMRETTNVEEVIFVEDESDRLEIDVGAGVMPVLKTFDFESARKRSKLRPEEAFRYFTLAVSDPVYKRRFVQKALAAGLEPAPTLIHPSAVLSGPIEVEPGGIIAAHTSILPLSRVGPYVTVAPQASLGHHCVVGKYGFVGAGSTVLGLVTLEEGVWVGGGATIRGYLHIAPWVKIGIQAAVTSDIEEQGIVVAGVPHKKLAQSWGR